MRFTTKLMTAAGAALILAGAPVAARADATMPHAPVAAVRSATPSATALTLSAVQDAKLEVDIDDDRGGAWYTNPVWIAIGVIALILIIALIAMAGRGRDTTVVK